MKLDDTVAAVVTGGASGLGLATATALRGCGVKVAIFDFNRETGEPAANAIGATFCHVTSWTRTWWMKALHAPGKPTDRSASW